ncbi:MAG: EamA family transporter [Bacteroidota bacterium]
MRLNAASLFAIPALIWGSTFYVIKFQLGSVEPGWSVSYRFILAGLMLLSYARIKGLNLKFRVRQHGWMLLQGSFLFGLNYWLAYTAEEVLISALVAVAFSSIIFMNILFGKLFLGKPINRKVFIGAIMGVLGTVLLFQRQLGAIETDDFPVFHLVVCFLSVLIASFGNITSARNQANGLPVIQTNAFGMIYGGIIMALIASFSGLTPSFDTSASYLLSLLYLAVFGSIFAFSTYLTLVGQIGADRAAYVLVVLPVIAVTLSILFEGYDLGWQVVAGILLIIGGNIIVLKK